VEPDVGVTARPRARDLVVSDQRDRPDLIRCGAELVEVSERFYRRLFLCGLMLVGGAAAAALGLLPLRHSATHDSSSAPALVAAVILIIGILLAIRRAETMYRGLRRHRTAEFALVLLAAGLIALVPPLQSELWLPSCAILSTLAILVSLRRAMAYCLVALMANLAAHVVAGDLSITPAGAVVGLWVGFPVWSAIVAVMSEHLAAHLLALNATWVPRRLPPRRVTAWTRAPIGDSFPAHDDGSASNREIPRRTDRLTARQRQVVLLLADGLLYGEVAACLSISVRQVDRHVANARVRAGARSVNELVALAVSEGIAPSTAGVTPDTATTAMHVQDDATNKPPW
jgi:DNA-binding CsgD family transcriptional regulator